MARKTLFSWSRSTPRRSWRGHHQQRGRGGGIRSISLADVRLAALAGCLLGLALTQSDLGTASWPWRNAPADMPVQARDPWAESRRSAEILRAQEGAPPSAIEYSGADEGIARGSGAAFVLCHSGGGADCVVDGDTFYSQGVKIRIADIDTPETHPPRCAYEADLGARATLRLQALLSAGPFELRAGARDADRYGRRLRTVHRDGTSLGDVLIGEGLARPYGSGRRSWC